MESITFVIDIKPRDEADLDRTRTLVGNAVKVLREEGVQLSGMGVGIAIGDSRERILDVFGKGA